MAWEELDFDKAHVAYFILGGFTSLFMLCSLFIKEKLYIGEATVATLVGLIFGPHAAGLFDPASWGNVDKLTLELSRIVLVVQCFAVGVELPKAYMERHWRSVFFLLVPVMTLGWLITGVIIYLCVYPLSWLESLAVAACVTATDPVLASSVVGKGKFAKRVPRHLRDILSAESGCNDGMAFPFIYLSFYLLQYHSEAKEVTFHWFVFLILYECIFGAIYGFIVGYIGRHAIKFAERHNLIDRDSFLVFYFVLALFCAGSASGLGLDDLLVGFSAGVGFSNDGWFVEKTEESHVSNVIDLLLNLSYFVYLGAIIPWEDFNNVDIGLEPWRLVVIALAVIFFRRIPAMLLMKPLIPDVKNWREALFAGHFGPIGVGAVFAVILLRAELETDSTEPLAELPGPENEFYLLIRTCWPIVSFLVISSILVHGSSIAVFTLGKRINTLTLTMSYTVDGEQNWMDRLPRIASRSKSMSISRGSRMSEDSISDEKADFAPGTLGPVGVPRNFLRRQQEDDDSSRPSGILPSRRSRNRRRRLSAGGPIDESAIAPVWRNRQEDQEKDGQVNEEETSPDSVGEHGKDGDKLDPQTSSDSSTPEIPEIEAYQEGDELIVEDEEGNVIDKRNIKGQSPERVRREILEDRDALRREKTGEHAKDAHHPHARNEGEEIENHILEGIEHPHQAWRKWLGQTNKGQSKPKVPRHSGPAQAYQYGDKIIVEDADGEVVKTYEIPKTKQDPKSTAEQGEQNVRRGLQRMSTWTFGRKESTANAGEDENVPPKRTPTEDENDKNLRFRVGGSDRRMSKQDFIKEIQSMDARGRIEAAKQSNAPEDLKRDIKGHAKLESRLNEQAGGNFLTRKLSRGDQSGANEGSNFLTRKLSRGEQGGASDGSNFLTRRLSRDDGAGTSGGIGSFLTRQLSRGQSKLGPSDAARDAEEPQPSPSRSPLRAEPMARGRSTSTASSREHHRLDSHGREIPMHDVAGTVAAVSAGQPETAAQRRRRLARRSPSVSPGRGRDDSDSDDDGTARVPPSARHRRPSQTVDLDDDQETAAERRRRLAALGQADTDEDSDDEGITARVPSHQQQQQQVSSTFDAAAAPPSQQQQKQKITIAEPARAHIRDRAVGAGGTGGVAGNVVPGSPIAEEDDDDADGHEDADEDDDPTSASSETPRSPGIRFAEMPRGEGRGRSRRFGRTMGMRMAKR